MGIAFAIGMVLIFLKAFFDELEELSWGCTRYVGRKR
jgi:hypothetical protein